MGRETRCQAVILKDNHILVARQYNSRRKEEYWMLPGGGLEEGESHEEGVKREVMEETNLEVEILKVLFDEPGINADEYNRYITFLCQPINLEMKAGSETVSYRKIIDLVWCSLEDENQWNEYILRKQFYPSMANIKREIAGYSKERR